MTLRRSQTATALWPSLVGVAFVLSIIGANLWSMWQAEPEPATMEPLQRLGALYNARSGLPATALAAAGDPETGGQFDAAGPASSGAVAGGTRSVAGVPRMAERSAGGEMTRSTVVQPGESLGAALGHLFIAGSVQRDVIAAYAKLRKPERLQAGWRLWARFATPTAQGPQPLVDGAALLAVVVAPSHGEGVTVLRDDPVKHNAKPAGDFIAHEGGLPGVVVRKAVRCGLVGPLDVALRRCGEEEATAILVAQILNDRLHPAVEAKTGDELRLVVDKLYDGDQVIRTIGVAALELRPPVGAKTTVVHFDDGHGTEGYFGLQGDAAEAMFLRQPLRSGHTTSGFGMRLHPILHKLKAHYGVDFAASTGTPIYAAADGVLISAHKAGAAGNLVRLRHGDGFVTEYMHMQKFAPGIDAGERVAKGQVIGYVGSTGRSTGPHLHFGVRKNGRYLDPTSLSDVLQPSVGGKARRGFESHAADVVKLLQGLDKGSKSGT